MARTNKDAWKEFRERIKAQVDWEKVATEILGLELIGNPTGQGWVSCRSVDGNDASPSASYNLESGYYKDFRDGEKAISAYDLMFELELANNFNEAQKIIADKFKVPFPVPSDEDPDHGVKWSQWLPKMLTQYCFAKPPITPEGIKAAGGKMCVRHGQSCIALPVVGVHKPHDIVGWMFLRRDGQEFRLKDTTAKCICKVHPGVKGFVTSPAIIHKIMDTTGQTIHWVEGGPDLLAGLSKFPNELFVTNPHGCSENLSDDQRFAVTSGDHQWKFIADSDVPGLHGASKRLAAIPGRATNIAILTPPYKVSDKHGKDYRDHLTENEVKNPLDGLTHHADLSHDKIEKQHEEQETEDMNRAHVREVKQAQEALAGLGCTILSVDHGGDIELYSEQTKSSKIIKSISILQYDDMIQFLGFKFKYKVFKKPEDMMAAERGGHLFATFKQMLALASTDIRYQDSQKVGAGIWAVEDEDHDRTGELLIVKHGEAYVYDGALRPTKPIVRRMIAKMSERVDWFNPMILGDYIERARNRSWRSEVYQDLHSILRQWNWADPNMAELCAGLIFATWAQAVHKWRPMVTVTGESNAGKTVLMQFIESQFLTLANASARSTAAGVMQSLGDNSQPILLDEFDNGSEQAGLLERFRVSSRGQASLYGTASQTGKKYNLHHLVWFSGIYAASRSQADMNRMINLRLKQAVGNKKTISLPEPSEIRDLGHKILAGVIVTANEALNLTDRLTESTGEEDIQSRYRESFAVPYGCLGAFLGSEYEGINDVMSDYLRDVVSIEVSMADASSDQDQLLLDILASEVRMPNDGSSPVDHASVAEILFKPNLAKYRDHARTKGVGYIIPRRGSTAPKVAFAGRRLTAKGGLLRGTEWHDRGAGLLQILERLPRDLNPRREKQQVAGSLMTVVSVDYKSLRTWVEGDKDRKEAIGLGEGS